MNAAESDCAEVIEADLEDLHRYGFQDSVSVAHGSQRSWKERRNSQRIRFARPSEGQRAVGAPCVFCGRTVRLLVLSKSAVERMRRLSIIWALACAIVSLVVYRFVLSNHVAYHRQDGMFSILLIGSIVGAIINLIRGCQNEAVLSMKLAAQAVDNHTHRLLNPVLGSTLRCPACGLAYTPDAYRTDAPDWYCSVCKGKLPKLA